MTAKLAKRLRGDDEPHYESLCHLAVARCEQSVGNSNAEAEALIAASRGFMEAEMKVQDVGCPSFEEHLLAGSKMAKSFLIHNYFYQFMFFHSVAIHSYAHAIRILEETNQTPRAAGLCLELGDSLHKLGKTGQALTFYQRAADLRSSTILEYIHAQEKVAICFIETGDYHNGLSTLTEVANVAEQYGGRPVASVYADMMGR